MTKKFHKCDNCTKGLLSKEKPYSHMTKDLGNIDQCKRAIEDVKEELRKYDNILKHLYPSDNLETNSQKVILVKRNHLEVVKNMLEKKMEEYKGSKNEEPIPKKNKYY